MITYIVDIYFDYDRPNLILTPEWIRHRFELFHKYTLRSLINQRRNFENYWKSIDDFRIWIYCGQRNKELTQSLSWRPDVKVLYDFGKDALSKIDTEFVALTRMDSDDLMHYKAMEEIMSQPVQESFLVFRKNLLWDRNNQFIGYHERSFPPFTTRIYPKSVYKDWEVFQARHHQKHGVESSRSFQIITELSQHKICVVKHKENIGNIRRGLKPGILTPKQIKGYIKKGKILTDKPEKIKRILEEFGVTYGME